MQGGLHELAQATGVALANSASAGGFESLVLTHAMNQMRANAAFAASVQQVSRHALPTPPDARLVRCLRCAPLTCAGALFPLAARGGCRLPVCQTTCSQEDHEMLCDHQSMASIMTASYSDRCIYERLSPQYASQWRPVAAANNS